ncbi:MAG: M15 family metallopeptidase [Bacilli bacterium]|nr:M15 family metallopeptidase [Bacilli bacterium]
METKRVLKKGVIKYGVITIIAILFIIFVIALIMYYTSDKYKLTKLGYSKEEAIEIVTIGKSNRVLNIRYSEVMLDILKGKYYIDNNLEKYLDYYDANKDKSIDDIIAIINVHAEEEFYNIELETDTSKGIEMIVNKVYGLDKEYVPEDIVNVSNWYAYGEQKVSEEVYEQYKLMFNAAKKENLTLIINDSYRSYEEQEKTHKRYGDDYAARPGHSEHNTGLAVDIIGPTSTGDTFEDSSEYQWLQEHAHEYGFILRYPKDKEYLTGYEYESWHYRYLGVELATKVHDSGITYDEYYAYYLDNK